MIKLYLRFLLSCTCMFMNATNANADFNKAVDAYIKNDVDLMLIEVVDAVNNKSNDGLMLFINSITFDGERIQPFTYNSSQEPELKKFFLDETRTQILFALLDAATQDNQYANFRLSAKRYIRDRVSKKLAFKKLAEQGLSEAALALYFEFIEDRNHLATVSEGVYWLNKAEQLGSPYAAYLISNQYLDNPVFGDRLTETYPTNQQLGLELAEKALLASDPLSDPFAELLGEISNLYKHGVGVNKDEAGEQVFLLDLVRAFSVDKRAFSSPIDGLMYKFYTIRKYRANQYTSENIENIGQFAFWCDSSCDTYNTNELNPIPPSWKTKTKLDLPNVLKRKPAHQVVKPVFSIRKLVGHDNVSFYEYRVDFYEDGRVALLRDPVVPDEVARSPSWSLSSKAVRNLVGEIKQLGFDGWRLVNDSNRGHGPHEIFSVMLRHNNSVKTVHFYEGVRSFDRHSTINRILYAVDKLIPIHDYASSQLGSGDRRLIPSRELEVHQLK